jgi:hemolysin activation/secretion protein
MFTAFQNHFLPKVRDPEQGGVRYKDLFNFGVHYHLNLLTPYWDPERGFQLDSSVAQGFEVFRGQEATQQANLQISMIRRLPDDLGWLSRTRVALRAYGAWASPSKAQLYSLGGSELFRGFDLAQRQGSSVWVGSAEWRVPLTRELDYQVWDRVANLKKIYAIGFYDVGSAYVANHQIDNIAHAVGGSLRIDIAWFSFLERTIFRVDVAKAVNVNTPVQYWFGMEHPF